MNAVIAYVRSLNPQLPRPVWLIEAGGVANALGNGIVIPFLVIYLHGVRHFGLGISGLVVACLLGIGIVGSPLAGRVVDRIGARATLMGSLAFLAAGYGGFPFVHHPWQAFGLALIAGTGNAGFAPSHSSLLAALTSREQRTAAYALIATTAVPVSFDVLFAVDAGTFLAFIGLLFFVPAVRAPAAVVTGGFRRVARDHTFVVLLGLTAVLVAAAYAQVATILPPYANEHAGVSPAGIGVVFFVNTIVLVIAQLPIAKALEGRRRFPALALTAALFAVTCATILVVGRSLHGSAAVVALCGMIVVFSLAECIHGAVNNPLIADLAPPELMGRYMGLRTSAFQLGYLAGPTLGSLMLATSTSGLWLGSAGACLAASAGFLVLGHQAPSDIDVTPGAARAPRQAFRVLWRTSDMTTEDPLSTDAQPAPHQAPDATHAHTGGSSTA
ncbi:MAG: MFS transporter [Actinobacteria bacterium]|nr:MAG: MFS transporter [Actinomycetota bacterium]